MGFNVIELLVLVTITNHLGGHQQCPAHTARDPGAHDSGIQSSV